MTLLRKIRETITEHELLRPGDSVLTAFSGGPDSVALLHLLARLRRSMKINLAAVYIDHRIRVKAVKKEIAFCQRMCDALRVDLTLVTEDIPALAVRRKRGVEETARWFRYQVFEQIARDDGYDRIAVGHHSDDQVETIFFRLIRGTGRQGLLGMPVVRGRIIRPLLYVSRREILDYLREKNLGYCEDHTNRSLKYSRNFIRHKLLPAVRERLNPQVDAALLNLAETLGEEEKYLEAVTRKVARKTVGESPGEKIELDLKSFSTYDMWVRRRLLRYCLGMSCREGLMPDRQVVERLDRLAEVGSGTISLPGKIRAAVIGHKLVFIGSGRGPFSHSLVPGNTLKLPWPRLIIGSRLAARSRTRVVKQPRARKVFLDWDKLAGPLSVRSIRPGDRFRPLGMRGRKKIGDYLTDRKVPREYRDEIPVVCDREGIVWLMGYELADRVKIDDKTRKVLTIEYSVRQTDGCSPF